MNLLEWLGMIGLAAARRLNQKSRSGALWRTGAGAVSSVKDRFSDRYVSETTPAYFQYVRRRYRSAVRCPVRYDIDGRIGEGVVVDMTGDGWRIQGQEEMLPGTVLRVDVMLPGVMSGVRISRAVVCWARGTEFGVKLDSVDAQSAAQLSEYFSRISQDTAMASKAA